MTQFFSYGSQSTVNLGTWNLSKSHFFRKMAGQRSIYYCLGVSQRQFLSAKPVIFVGEPVMT